MASLDSRDGRTELEGKEGQDTSMDSAPSSHVSYRVEEPGSEGYSAGDGTRPGPTMMQKLKEKVSDYENQLKGKESSVKEDPHPELSYIQPGDGKGEAVTDLQEGKQHGGLPTAALGNDVPAEVTRDYMSSVKDEKPGGLKKHFSGEGVNEPTVMERIKEKFSEAENHMKGKKSSAIEDPHPELAYITPAQEEKPGFFSRMEHKFGGQEKERGEAAAVPKGTGSSELGIGYEEDAEETLNPAAVPKYDEGVKPQP